MSLSPSFRSSPEKKPVGEPLYCEDIFTLSYFSNLRLLYLLPYLILSLRFLPLPPTAYYLIFYTFTSVSSLRSSPKSLTISYLLPQTFASISYHILSPSSDHRPCLLPYLISLLRSSPYLVSSQISSPVSLTISCLIPKIFARVSYPISTPPADLRPCLLPYLISSYRPLPMSLTSKGGSRHREKIIIFC